MKTIFKKQLAKSILLLSFVSIFTSCTDDLDKEPQNSKNGDDFYTSVVAYKQGLAGVYSPMVYSTFLRYYWAMQEYTTDEAVSTWNNDGGVGIYHDLAWSADTPAIRNVYHSVLGIITLSNDYLNQTKDEVIAKRGFVGNDAAQIKQFRAEARFIRAYAFWILMDCYGNPPFPTEETLANSNPQQIERAKLFEFLESELKAIEPILAEARTNERGRPDKAAAWALLSRMYLNAKVYTNNERYTDAITYCKKIIEANYSLESKYEWLMLGDNHLNTNEFIFTINYDSANTSWSGTNYLCQGQAGTTAEILGTGENSWQEFRFTQQIPNLFPTTNTTVDKRALFYTSGQNKDVNTVSVSTDGYSATKYINKDRNGKPLVQNNSFRNLSDIDFPIFRLSEIYLTYAEAVIQKGTGGSEANAVLYLNKIRERAYQNSNGNITATSLNLNYILDERARELYWETHRRTDLVRHNKLTTSSYLWAWKGGSKAGQAVDAKYNLFPIPAYDLSNNPNLKQNTGF